MPTYYFDNKIIKENQADEVEDAVSELLFQLAEHLDLSNERHSQVVIKDIKYLNGSLSSYSVTVVTEPD